MQSGCKAGGLVSCWAAKEAGWRGVEEPGGLLRSQAVREVGCCRAGLLCIQAAKEASWWAVIGLACRVTKVVGCRADALLWSWFAIQLSWHVRLLGSQAGELLDC